MECMEKHDVLAKLKSIIDKQAHEHQFAVTYKDRKYVHKFVTTINNNCDWLSKTLHASVFCMPSCKCPYTSNACTNFQLFCIKM